MAGEEAAAGGRCRRSTPGSQAPAGFVCTAPSAAAVDRESSTVLRPSSLRTGVFFMQKPMKKMWLEWVGSEGRV